MNSLKTMLIICALVVACYGESRDVKHKYKHKYDLYWHGFHYLAFLAIKFKVIFILGTIFTIGVVAGKIFAIFKFAEYMKKHYSLDDHHEKHYSLDDHHEKIVYVNPHSSMDDYPGGGFSAPGAAFSKSYTNGGSSYHESFPPGFSLDQPPPNAHISASGGNFNAGGTAMYNSMPAQAYGAPQGYGRSIDIEGNSFYRNFNTFITMIRRLNVTDMVFEDMDLKTDDCKRKFVCEADFNAKGSIILKNAFNLLSDDSYTRYKTKKKIKSLDECERLYPNCLQSI